MMNEVNFVNLTLEVLLKSGIFITSLNISNILLENIYLNKIHKYKNSIIRELPPIDIESVEKRKGEIESQKIKVLLPYLKKLEKYTSEENLKTAYRNLKDVKVSRSLKPILRFSESYSSLQNKIEYIFKKNLCHEFLHLASTYYSEKTKELFSGFRQWKSGKEKGAEIGTGINEGYTELLASRIEKKKPSLIYRKQAKIAELFEYFFDNPKDMEDYYFNHNLPGLIKHLEQFASREEIIDLIQLIDKFNGKNQRIGLIYPEYQFIKIQLTLYEWYKRKEKSSLKLGSFRRKICSDKIVSIFLNRKIKLQRKSLKGTPIFKIDELVEEKEKRNKLSEDKIKEGIEFYAGRPFDEVYCKIFHTTKDKINLIEAVRLFCLMTDIEFPKSSRKELNTLSRKVQCLILPDKEKTDLEYEAGRILQENIDYIWLNKINEQSKQKIKKCQ